MARKDKSLAQQIQDLEKAIAKFGDWDGTRGAKLAKLKAEFAEHLRDKTVNFGIRYGVQSSTIIKTP